MVDLAPAHSPMFSVVIPTMNEPLIQSLVDRVHFELGFVNHEVVVVERAIALYLSALREFFGRTLEG